jgi:hypothetical protein
VPRTKDIFWVQIVKYLQPLQRIKRRQKYKQTNTMYNIIKEEQLSQIMV